jgi:inhibitor of KinA
LINNLTYKPFGNKAILIEWEAIIDQEILKNIIEFKEKVSFQKIDFYVDFIIAYNSLTILYKNEIIDFEKEVEQLKSIYISAVKISKQTNYIWQIPVCYDVKFGVDLEEISTISNLEIVEIIKIHSEKIYTIFFIGFLPGFLYLGGLDTPLFFERKATPRLSVDKGAVGIGGMQTGVYPSKSAGGWNIIGRTPSTFFDVEKENPCFAKAGDQIKFNPISLDEFDQLEKEIAENKYQLFKTKIDA